MDSAANSGPGAVRVRPRTMGAVVGMGLAGKTFASHQNGGRWALNQY
ncbi:MAG: hypothetical protein J6C11_04765 [Spirochaetaceae bacterium]|nr:hypothetical protein [Spirochaetaceae bacterium]MBQ7365817.1 hypothetical protein [Spirochaetaceae bacterium]